MLHRIRIEPVRLRFHDQGLVTDVLRGVGFRFQCRCGVWGSTRKTAKAARADYADHVRDATEAEKLAPLG